MLSKMQEVESKKDGRGANVKGDGVRGDTSAIASAGDGNFVEVLSRVLGGFQLVEDNFLW